MRTYYLEEPSLSIKAIGLKIDEKIEIIKDFNNVKIVKELCSKLNNLNSIRLVVYDDRELFPIKIIALKNEIFCRGLFELDNRLMKVVINEKFNNIEIYKLAKFFGFSLCSNEKIQDFIFSNDLNSLEFCLKKDLEFLDEIYKKLEKNFL